MGGVPLPLDLSPLGAPGCLIHVDFDPTGGAIVMPLGAAGDGTAELDVPLASRVALLGETFYVQYLSLDAPAGRQLPLSTSNALRTVVGL